MLHIIQGEIKAPKNLYNKFGQYNYRSAESILEAVKPILAKHGFWIVLNDTMQYIGNRYYIVATATITNEQGQTFSATGFAREEESKKGMDAAQITGSASSYARKYALNGLFAIDDVKDSDYTNTHTVSDNDLESLKKLVYSSTLTAERRADALAAIEAVKDEAGYNKLLTSLKKVQP